MTDITCALTVLFMYLETFLSNEGITVYA
jgi:hypothetical protein